MNKKKHNLIQRSSSLTLFTVLQGRSNFFLLDVLGMSGPSHENSDTTFRTRPDYNSVSFIIIAMKDEVIRKAIKKLESSLEKEMHTKIIDDHTICQLEDIQVSQAYIRQLHV
jgi:hypothetical protein